MARCFRRSSRAHSNQNNGIERVGYAYQWSSMMFEVAPARDRTSRARFDRGCTHNALSRAKSAYHTGRSRDRVINKNEEKKNCEKNIARVTRPLIIVGGDRVVEHSEIQAAELTLYQIGQPFRIVVCTIISCGFERDAEDPFRMTNFRINRPAILRS